MFDAVFKNLHAATLSGPAGYGIIKNAGLGIKDGKIAYIGPESDLPGDGNYEFDGEGRFLTPALIDCHTHLIYAGNRADEFEERLNGASYQDIAKSGGGILSTVKATRGASEDMLEKSALARIKALFHDGVAAFEIKSGYGLDLESERKMLRVATSLRDGLGLKIQRTFLGAHALPPEYAGRPNDYIDYLCKEMLPLLVTENLVDTVDGFCENIAFSTAQIEKLFQAAKNLGLPVKLHAEQLSNIGASIMAAKFKPLSCDHVEYIDEAAIHALAAAGAAVTLLPGAFYNLKEKTVPPVNLFREHNIPMAVATDHNPGTSPLLSLTTAMNMACVLFGLTPEESLRGATVNAARALGWAKDMGSLNVGKTASLALWDIDHPRDLSYYTGGRLCAALYVAGNYHNFTN